MELPDSTAFLRRAAGSVLFLSKALQTVISNGHFRILYPTGITSGVDFSNWSWSRSLRCRGIRYSVRTVMILCRLRVRALRVLLCFPDRILSSFQGQGWFSLSRNSPRGCFFSSFCPEMSRAAARGQDVRASSLQEFPSGKKWFESSAEGFCAFTLPLSPFPAGAESV